MSRSILICPGIFGQAVHFDQIIKDAGGLPILADYDTSVVEGGLDAAARRAISALHMKLSLLDAENNSRYVLLGHSAGGCVVHRIAEILLGAQHDDSSFSALLPKELQGMAIMALPFCVVAVEPSMLLSDVDGWASDWASHEQPLEEEWLKEILRTTHWTWDMCRAVSAGLVQSCPDPSPQVDVVRRCALELPGHYVYVCGSRSTDRNAQARTAIEKLKGVQFYELQDAGHNVHKDQPAALTSLLERVISEKSIVAVTTHECKKRKALL